MRRSHEAPLQENRNDPVAALAAQRSAVAAAGGAVYSEVPNGDLMVEQCALWDLIYEHLSYFTASSLDLACRRAGLTVTQRGVAFGDQFMWNEANLGEASDAVDTDAVAAAVDAAVAFGENARQRIATARH